MLLPPSLCFHAVCVPAMRNPVATAARGRRRYVSVIGQVGNGTDRRRRRRGDDRQTELGGRQTAAVDNIMKNWRIGMQRMAEIEYVEEDAVLSPAYIDVTTMPLSHRLHDISDHIVMKILNALIPNFQSPARPRGGTRSRISNNHA